MVPHSAVKLNINWMYAFPGVQHKLAMTNASHAHLHLNLIVILMAFHNSQLIISVLDNNTREHASQLRVYVMILLQALYLNQKYPTCGALNNAIWRTRHESRLHIWTHNQT